MGPGLRAGGRRTEFVRRWCALCGALLALALLVAQVLADHHDPPVPADHLALVTDLLDARLDLHGRFSPTCTGRRSDRETGRTATVPRRHGLPGGCGCSAAASCR